MNTKLLSKLYRKKVLTQTSREILAVVKTYGTRLICHSNIFIFNLEESLLMGKCMLKTDNNLFLTLNRYFHISSESDNI